jgi:hypothetical protein
MSKEIKDRKEEARIDRSLTNKLLVSLNSNQIKIGWHTSKVCLSWQEN